MRLLGSSPVRFSNGVLGVRASSALALVDDLTSQVGKTAGEIVGHKGGSATAHKFGPDHFGKLAALRKTRGGGRPHKPS